MNFINIFSHRHLYLFLALLAGLLIYIPSLTNDFVSFDDDELILENNLVQKMDVQNIQTCFTSHQMGHYLPLTTLSYALQYYFFEKSPFSYHLFSLILHLLNGLLLYFILNALNIDRVKVGLIVLIFILHPMNVESVAWISARSNVLFSFFYLVSIYSYLVLKGTRKQILTFLFFILACLSKSSAVTLPLVLIWIDLYKKERFQAVLFYSKIHFFVGSLFFGLLAMYFATEFGTLNTQKIFEWFEKPFLSAFALLFYVFKYMIPTLLSALHLFPNKVANLPVLYYLSLPMLLLLVFLAVKYVKNKLIILSVLWFLIHIFLNLQWITIGKVFAAERYAYLSYVGLSMVLVELIPAKWFKMIFLAVFFVFGAITYSQTRVWNNSNTLYSQVILRYPNHGYGYYGKGIFYKDQQQYDSALVYFSNAILKEKYFPNAYLNRANVYLLKNQIPEAIEDYKQVIAQKPAYKEAYFNLGYLYYKQGYYANSYLYLEKAIQLGVGGAYVYFLMAENADQLGRESQACSYYKHYLYLGGEKISRINYCGS